MLSESMIKNNCVFVPTFLSMGLETYMVEENSKHNTESSLIRVCFHPDSFNTSERKAFRVLKRSEIENKSAW